MMNLHGGLKKMVMTCLELISARYGVIGKGHGDSLTALQPKASVGVWMLLGGGKGVL